MVDGEAGILIVKQPAYENGNAVCQTAFHPFRKNRDLNLPLCWYWAWTLHSAYVYLLSHHFWDYRLVPPSCLPFVWVLEPWHTSPAGQGLYHLSHQPSFLSGFGCTTHYSTYYIKYNIHVINIIPNFNQYSKTRNMVQDCGMFKRKLYYCREDPSAVLSGWKTRYNLAFWKQDSLSASVWVSFPLRVTASKVLLKESGTIATRVCAEGLNLQCNTLHLLQDASGATRCLPGRYTLSSWIWHFQVGFGLNVLLG